jgi:alcohol dehydrogenase
MPGGPFELVEREIPAPDDDQVLIRVHACGICHSDSLVKEGHWPGIEYPRVPGHEVAGTISAVGKRVANWKPGDRVGVGWHGGHCFVCENCRRGDFMACRSGKITGFSFDGGYSDYMTAPAEAVARMPEDMPFDEAAPLLCAGITVYNALRNSGARAGDLVAVHGIGGLGHLAIQYARQMGFRTIAIGRRPDKEPLAMQLGAHQYIDSEAADPAAELMKLGGARVALACAPDSAAIAALVGGLGVNGKLVMVAAPAAPMAINPVSLIMNRSSIAGWPSGTAVDSEDTMRFSAMAGVRPMINRFSLADVEAAYEHMMTGKTRFRVVLTMTD